LVNLIDLTNTIGSILTKAISEEFFNGIFTESNPSRLGIALNRTKHLGVNPAGQFHGFSYFSKRVG
jgi:hypothetical protein